MLSRRKFFRGLAVVPVSIAAGVALKLPAPKPSKFLKSIRIGMPLPQWRKIYQGIRPSRDG